MTIDIQIVSHLKYYTEYVRSQYFKNNRRQLCKYSRSENSIPMTHSWLDFIKVELLWTQKEIEVFLKLILKTRLERMYKTNI